LGLDSTKMMATLSNVDLTQNTSISSGNLTMSINHTDVSTTIRWGFQDFLTFDVSFHNNFPVSFYDERQISSTIPTSTPTVPELPSWAILLLLALLVVTAGLLVYHKKHKR
jgi:hypothetical protein